MKTNTISLTLSLLFFASILQSCNKGEASHVQEAAVLPVVSPLVKNISLINTYRAAVEGKNNVEIRPQVDGYIDKIYVDEGAYVRKGQPLFRINERSYREVVAQAQGALQAAEAQRDKAKLEVERLSPLVERNVVSDIQLKTAESSYRASLAGVAQAQAMLLNAQTNLGYTMIKAPVDGYIGRIPYREGALVGRGEPMALTNISEIGEVYAYFSMSESEFFSFIQSKEGKTIEEKLKQIPEVELQLPDGSIYSSKGKVQLMQGQFDKNIGAITLRAAFPNKEGLLRSGITGTIRIPQQETGAILIPQQATYDVQDKTFVFKVDKENRVISTPVTIKGKKGNYYLLKEGIAPNDKLVLTGLGHLRDSVAIKPQLLEDEALLKQIPLE